MRESIYLDYAAATPVCKIAQESLQTATEYFANTSAQYQSGREAAKQLARHGKIVAAHFAINPEETVFTSGATESNNLAILGLARANSLEKILTLRSEHASVLGPIMQLKKEGAEVIFCTLDKKGSVNMAELEKHLLAGVDLVVISMASSEVATLQPLEKIGAAIVRVSTQQTRKIYFHSDVSACVATHTIQPKKIGLDTATVSSAKIYGPKGIGLAYIARGVELEPLLYGGSQQNGLRSGTESLPLIAGFASALQECKIHRGSDEQHYKSLFALVEKLLKDHKIPATIVGDPKRRLYHIVSMYLDGLNGEDLVAAFDAKGIEISSGAACEASSEEPSQALIALGLTRQQAQASIRVSFGRATTAAEVEHFASTFVSVLRDVQERSK